MTLSVLKWWIDASFAIHPDFKSHTGGAATGVNDEGGAITALSQKQKLNTRSSTEAELVGADDMMTMVLWTALFMEAQGYRIERNIIMQDNKSAILLETNGRSSGGDERTRPALHVFDATEEPTMVVGTKEALCNIAGNRVYHSGIKDGSNFSLTLKVGSNCRHGHDMSQEEYILFMDTLVAVCEHYTMHANLMETHIQRLCDALGLETPTLPDLSSSRRRSNNLILCCATKIDSLVLVTCFFLAPADWSEPSLKLLWNPYWERME